MKGSMLMRAAKVFSKTTPLLRDTVSFADCLININMQLTFEMEMTII